MAKKQSRRTISLNRGVYAAVKRVAAQRGVPLSAIVESALAAFGVTFDAQGFTCADSVNPVKPAKPVKPVKPAKPAKPVKPTKSAKAAVKTAKLTKAGVKPAKLVKPATASPAKLPSLERQMLGDRFADAYGFR